MSYLYCIFSRQPCTERDTIGNCWVRGFLKGTFLAPAPSAPGTINTMKIYYWFAFGGLLILPDWFLCSASVLVNTGSTRSYLQPNQLAQVVHFLQDNTFIHAVARRFAISPFMVSRAWRRDQPLHEDWYLLLCARRNLRSTARASIEWPLRGEHCAACNII